MAIRSANVASIRGCRHIFVLETYCVMAKGKNALKKGDTIVALVNDTIYTEKIESIENGKISIPGVSFKIGPNAYAKTVAALAKKQSGEKPGQGNYVMVIWQNQFQWRLVSQTKPDPVMGILTFLRGITGVAFTEDSIFNSAEDAGKKLSISDSQPEEDLTSDETEEG